jgi:predicted nuclease of predicted toxin-antitoxin system
MRFLVDAQLPKHLAESLTWWGCDVVHTLDLPDENRTPDWRINEISVAEQRKKGKKGVRQKRGQVYLSNKN